MYLLEERWQSDESTVNHALSCHVRYITSYCIVHLMYILYVYSLHNTSYLELAQLAYRSLCRTSERGCLCVCLVPLFVS